MERFSYFEVADLSHMSFRLITQLIFLILLSPSSLSQGSLDSLYQILQSDIDNEEAYALTQRQLAQNIYDNPEQIKKQSQKIADLYRDKKPLKWAMSMRLHALSYYTLEDYDTALDILLPLIDLVKEHGSNVDLGHIYSALSLAYKLRGELETVEKYSKEAIALYRADGKELMAATTANNLATHYMEQERYEDSEIYYEQAIRYFRDNDIEQSLAVALLNRGSSYILQDKNELGIADITESLPILEKFNYKLAYATAYTSLGNAYLNLSQLEKAEEYLNKGYTISKEANHAQQISIAAELLSRLNASKNKFESAYFYQKEWHTLQDSFKSSEQDQRLVDALQKYESEKKQQEITILSNKNRIANQNTIIALSGVGALGLFAFFMFRNRNRVQAMNQILESQKIEISKNLNDKEFLLKEIHHRVKNNLQVISSLLKLQSKSLTDTKAKQALDDGRVRVRSMALIHQNLYQKDNLSGIKMDDYIYQMTQELIETYQISKYKIHMDIDVAPIILDVETVVPIGLIINELVSNSIKYAFDNDSEGRIAVNLNLQEDQLILEVSDDGRGYDQNAIRKDSFGLGLIDAFAHRLNAIYTIDSMAGTRAIFNISTFKLAA